MSSLRFAAAAFGVGGVIVACSVYGSDEEPTITPDGTDSGSRVDAAENDVLVPVDGGAEGEAAAPTIDCLGAQRPAFFCDGFEGAMLGNAWTPVKMPAGDSRPDIGITTQKAIAGGARSTYLGFSTLPANGVSMIRWTRAPAANAPLAVQWSFFWPKDGFDVDQVFPIAALRSDDQRAATLSIRITGSDAAGDLLLTIAAENPINLGTVTANAWSCIELVHDGTNLTVYRAATAQVSRPLAKNVDAFELGYEWPYPENNGAGAGLYVDDVIVSGSRIPCIH